MARTPTHGSTGGSYAIPSGATNQPLESSVSDIQLPKTPLWPAISLGLVGRRLARRHSQSQGRSPRLSTPAQALSPSRKGPRSPSPRFQAGVDFTGVEQPASCGQPTAALEVQVEAPAAPAGPAEERRGVAARDATSLLLRAEPPPAHLETASGPAGPAPEPRFAPDLCLGVAGRKVRGQGQSPQRIPSRSPPPAGTRKHGAQGLPQQDAPGVVPQGRCGAELAKPVFSYRSLSHDSHRRRRTVANPGASGLLARHHPRSGARTTAASAKKDDYQSSAPSSPRMRRSRASTGQCSGEASPGSICEDMLVREGGKPARQDCCPVSHASLTKRAGRHSNPPELQALPDLQHPVESAGLDPVMPPSRVRADCTVELLTGRSRVESDFQQSLCKAKKEEDVRLHRHRSRSEPPSSFEMHCVDSASVASTSIGSGSFATSCTSPRSGSLRLRLSPGTHKAFAPTTPVAKHELADQQCMSPPRLWSAALQQPHDQLSRHLEPPSQKAMERLRRALMDTTLGDTPPIVEGVEISATKRSSTSLPGSPLTTEGPLAAPRMLLLPAVATTPALVSTSVADDRSHTLEANLAGTSPGSRPSLAVPPPANTHKTEQVDRLGLELQQLRIENSALRGHLDQARESLRIIYDKDNPEPPGSTANLRARHGCLPPRSSVDRKAVTPGAVSPRSDAAARASRGQPAAQSKSARASLGKGGLASAGRLTPRNSG